MELDGCVVGCGSRASGVAVAVRPGSAAVLRDCEVGHEVSASGGRLEMRGCSLSLPAWAPCAGVASGPASVVLVGCTSDRALGFRQGEGAAVDVRNCNGLGVRKQRPALQPAAAAAE